jgi:hypothetical protein
LTKASVITPTERQEVMIDESKRKNTYLVMKGTEQGKYRFTKASVIGPTKRQGK